MSYIIIVSVYCKDQNLQGQSRDFSHCTYYFLGKKVYQCKYVLYAFTSVRARRYMAICHHLDN